MVSFEYGSFDFSRERYSQETVEPLAFELTKLQGMNYKPNKNETKAALRKILRLSCVASKVMI